eukprot:TRINITY_DN15019_c0_g3_i1.p1 TRINITY_DN15019_c0_g3~~TRINITY_DN15019_c0_g3_i1.p1  ORF type:complete len:187 (+),score=13.79 TRINITY_DN15019_c0_g3_i1:176-736(+)
MTWAAADVAFKGTGLPDHKWSKHDHGGGNLRYWKRGDENASMRSRVSSSVHRMSSVQTLAAPRPQRPIAPQWVPPPNPDARAGCLSGIQYRPERPLEESIHPVHPAMLYSGHMRLPSLPGYTGYIPRKVAENVVGRTYAKGNVEAARIGQPWGIGLPRNASAPLQFGGVNNAAASSQRIPTSALRY